nr:hypothetical protein ISGA_607 [Gordonia sp. NB41Y]
MTNDEHTESASDILARGIRNVADEHRVIAGGYRYLAGGRFVRNDYADKLAPKGKPMRIVGDGTSPQREDFPNVSDDNYHAAEAKNLIRCGWLARKQTESLGKGIDSPARWLAKAIAGEQARETAPRRRFQEV